MAAGCGPTIAPPATEDLATVDFAGGVGGNGASGDLAAPAEPRDLAADLAVAAAADLAPPVVAHDLGVAHDLAAAASGDLAVAALDLSAPSVIGDLAPPAVAPDLATAADLGNGGDMARCPYAPAGGALYLLAPSGAGLFAARARAGAWTTLPAAAGSVAIDDVALASVADRPLAVVRQHDATLAAVTFDDCSGFVAPAPIATLSSALRPALVGGATADVVFRGNVNGDARLYWLHDDGSGLGSGAVATEGNFLSTLVPAAFRAGSDVHAIFTGTNDNLYDGVVQASGGGTATALTGNTSSRAPAVAVDASGAVHVLYSGNDNHVYSFVAAQPTAVHSLCDGQPASCFVVTDAAPLLAIGSDDTPVAVYHGSDGALYSAELVGGAWTTVVPVAPGETTKVAAAIVTGSAGSIVDVIYVRDGDGLPRHASLGTSGWSAPITVANTPLTGAPALAVAP